MRDRLAFALVLGASAALAALLLAPRFRGEASSDQETAPSPPPASALAAAALSALPDAAADGAGDAEPPPPPPAYVRVDPTAKEACPEGMLLVDGIYCPFVGHRCLRYASEAHDICQVFAPEVLCEGRLQRRRFCADRFEYPNLEGVRPVMMISFEEAKRACALEGKRLCTVEEWEFACEGTQMWPYPYGLSRDKEACAVDRDAPPPDPALLAIPRAAAEAVERADGRVPSGEMRRCVSPFGVHDMTGNVDEWTINTTAELTGKPITAAVKGGSWGRSRARCRPIAEPPPESERAFGVGLRCCADAKGSERSVSVVPPGAVPPRKRTLSPPEP